MHTERISWRGLLAAFFIVVALVIIVSQVTIMLAQDEGTPEPTPVVDPVDEVPVELPDIPVIPVEEAAALLIATIVAILVGLADSPITTAIVAILKRISILDPVPSNILQFAVAGVIAAIYWVTSALGYGPDFKSIYAFLLTTAPALAGWMARQAASSALYKTAKAQDVGVWGYQRPAEAARAAAAVTQG